MISRIHQKLGTAGFVISIVALVAALCGGAYAAGGGLTGKQKKEVTKIAKKYAGKPGAPGANGTNGAPGAKGDKGDAGAAGSNGTNGTDGTNGESVEVNPYAGEECEGGSGEEGVELTNATGAAYVCNGEAGEPWPAGGTLPPGATETGAWSMNSSGPFVELYTGISFAVPLNGALPGSNVHFVSSTGGGVCDGTAAEPTAPEGVLCVYQSYSQHVPVEPEIFNASGLVGGASKSGAFVYFEEVEANALAYGTWAVTGG